MSGHDGPEWMTTAEVAEYLRVTDETVRRWIRAGEIAVLDLGGRRGGYRIRRADLDTFVSERFGPVGKELAA